LRPFAYVCKTSFEFLSSKIADSALHMRADKDHIIVRNLDYKDIIEFKSSDGRPQKWTLHTALYGKMTNASFTHRENTHEIYGIISPFVALQHIYREKGLYLTNESDPAKGFRLVIVLRRAPLQDATSLWHGQNIVPSEDDSVRMLIDRFYLADIKDAAHFVNNIFAQKNAV